MLSDKYGIEAHEGVEYIYWKKNKHLIFLIQLWIHEIVEPTSLWAEIGTHTMNIWTP